jgi:hypothetical protein
VEGLFNSYAKGPLSRTHFGFVKKSWTYLKLKEKERAREDVEFSYTADKGDYYPILIN